MRVGIGVLLAILLLLLPSPAPAQTTHAGTWVAAYGATTLAEGLGICQPHVGGRLAVPLTHRVDFYPGLELASDLSFSMTLFDVRVKPIASYGDASAWYVGGGVAVADRDLVSDLLTGVQWPTGRWRPFFEAHLFNGVNGGGVLHAGLAVVIS